MSSRKQRRRSRRRVEKQFGEAWEALARGEEHLARKIAARSLEEGRLHARAWVEYGELQQACGDEGAAREAFREAWILDPNHRPALAHLARIHAEEGLWRDAVEFQERLVERGPEDTEASALLASYRERLAALLPRSPEPEREEPLEPPSPNFPKADVERIAGEVLACGCTRLPRSFGETALLASKNGEMAEEGLEDWTNENPAARAFVNDALHWIVRVAERRARDLRGETPSSRPRPFVEWLAPEASGVDTLRPWPRAHRLAPAGILVAVSGTTTFVQEDRGLGKRPHRIELRLEPGDAIAFGLRERLVTVGGAIGLQPIVQGISGSRALVVLARRGS